MQETPTSSSSACMPAPTIGLPVRSIRTSSPAARTTRSTPQAAAMAIHDEVVAGLNRPPARPSDDIVVPSRPPDDIVLPTSEPGPVIDRPVLPPTPTEVPAGLTASATVSPGSGPPGTRFSVAGTG